jgi:hypothetical protein
MLENSTITESISGHSDVVEIPPIQHQVLALMQIRQQHPLNVFTCRWTVRETFIASLMFQDYVI